jgi:hypothetical protein
VGRGVQEVAGGDQERSTAPAAEVPGAEQGSGGAGRKKGV